MWYRNQRPTAALTNSLKLRDSDEWCRKFNSIFSTRRCRRVFCKPGYLRDASGSGDWRSVWSATSNKGGAIRCVKKCSVEFKACNANAFQCFRWIRIRGQGWGRRSRLKSIKRRVFIEDLRSTNGASVSGHNIEGKGPVSIINGDQIFIGSIVMTLKILLD